MADEAMFSITKNYHNIKGRDLQDFQDNVEGLLGEGAFAEVAASFAEAFLNLDGQDRQAERNVRGGLGAERVEEHDDRPSRGGQQRRRYDQPRGSGGNRGGGQRRQSRSSEPEYQYGEDAPPTLPYPGDCDHGERQFFSKHPTNGRRWERWECALKWTKDNKDDRCKTINAEDV